MSTSLAQLTDSEFSREKIDLIKRTIAVGATDDELQLFLYTAKKTGLDPLTRQIYAVKRWNKAAGRDVMTVQTGIDGFRVTADRTGKLAGITDPVYDIDTESHPGRASVTVKKLVDGITAEFTATARWSEYVPQSGQDYMWKKMPYLMLGKCAEALALRKAFPADLSGVYTTEEMAQADNDAQRDAVYAEVERQKTVYAPKPDADTTSISDDVVYQVPPELDFHYVKSTGILICRIMDAKLTKKKKGDGEVLTLKLNNSIEGKSAIYYFHNTHKELLLNAIGKVVKLVVEKSGDFTSIADVLEVDGQSIQLAGDSLETQARLVASALDYTEDQLQETYKGYCNSSWAMTLEVLKSEKVRRESGVEGKE